jgi:SagB-type dehydrogenase family enzyme
LPEVHKLLQEALARAGNSLEWYVWTVYGLLADAIVKTSDFPDEGTALSLRALADNYRHISEYGPRLSETLQTLSPSPSFGRAVILERLARCSLRGNRAGTATVLFKEALETLDRIVTSPGNHESALMLRQEANAGLGDALTSLGKETEAARAFEAALAIAKDLGDMRGESILQQCLGEKAIADNKLDEAVTRFQRLVHIFKVLQEPESEAGAQQILVTAYEKLGTPDEAARPAIEADTPSAERCCTVDIAIREEIYSEIAFGTELLIDLPTQSQIRNHVDEPAAAPGHLVPTLTIGVRTWSDARGHCQFYVPAGEPTFEVNTDCVTIRRCVRQLTIVDQSDLAWILIRELDGSKAIDEISMAFPEGRRKIIANLIGALASNGAIDLSDRPIGSFLHCATKKGVFQTTGISSDEILRLASDGDHREYREGLSIPLKDDVPIALEALHSLTRLRRSHRDYCGKPIKRSDLDALLHTACGITGAVPWRDRKVNLRAYPSSGALYAVEIYPVIFSVENLNPGVYHYAAVEHGLDVVKQGIDKEEFLAATLPSEREMVSGIAAIICLTGRFKRHEAKYGQGGYRMMVAEAGHISQNLVLTAVALGLAARPFGGVFDSLVNAQLGLDESEEQFLLSVLIGHCTQ